MERSVRRLPRVTTPLAGRDEELALLTDAVVLAEGGASQLIFLSGEPGVGKSRLLAEASKLAGARGWVVLRGGAYEGQRLSAYQPFVEVLRECLDLVGVSSTRRLAGTWASQLGRLLPELGRERRRVAPVSDEQGPLYEAVAAIIRRFAADSPVLIVLDDLQWADPACLDLLLYVRRRLRSAHLLVLAAYRDTDVVPDGALQLLLVELNHQRLAVPIQLTRLGASTIASLSSGILRGAISPGLADVVNRDSEGNPFIAEEVVQSMLEQGQIFQTGETWDVASGAVTDLPLTVRDAVRSRLRRLPSETYAALQLASILGRGFSVDQLSRGLSSSEVTTAEQLASAERRGLIEPDGDNYRFSHDKIRETLYRDILAPDRRRLHRRAAEILQSVAVVPNPAEVAYHLLHGPDPRAALPFLLAAGEQTMATCAYRQAASHFQAAARLLRAEPGILDSRESRLLLTNTWLRNGTALTGAGDYQAALEALEQALASVDRVDPPVCENETTPPSRSNGSTSLATLLGEIYERQGAVYLAREEPEQAEGSLRRALAAYTSAQAPRRADVHVLLGQLYVSVTGDLVAGTSHLEQAKDLARNAVNSRLEAEAISALGQAAMHRGDFAAGRRFFEDALAIAERLNDPAATSLASDGLARGFYWAADFHKLRATAARELSYARRAGDPHRLGWPLFWQTQACIGLGLWHEAENVAARLARLGEELGARRFLAQGKELAGVVSLSKGEAAVAVTQLSEAVGVFREIAPGTLVYYLGPYALALLAADSTARASAVVDETLALAQRFPMHSSPRVQACNVTALALLSLGRIDEADRLYPELLPAERQHHWHIVARTLGMLATASNRFDAASRHLAVARDIAVEGGGQVELANVLFAEAELCRRRGAPERAEQLERQGDDLFAAFGATRLPIRQSGSSPPTGASAGLSPREIEVLRLVAEGKTNRDIAEALSISEKTATNHLTHIFNKIGCDNRSGATAYAFRHGLAGVAH